MAHLGEDRRKIEETTEAILDEILVGVITLHEEQNFQLKSLQSELLRYSQQLTIGRNPEPTRLAATAPGICWGPPSQTESTNTAREPPIDFSCVEELSSTYWWDGTLDAAYGRDAGVRI